MASLAPVLTSSLTLLSRAKHLKRLDPYDYSNCTVSTCRIDTSYYFYRINFGVNTAFLTLFSISLLGFLIAFAVTRRATAFTVAMVAGVALEVVGYVGRIQSWENQWSQNGFLIQIVCLTIAPAFIAGGIYLCLRRIVYAFGPDNSRIKPESYTRIFIPCDLASLLLQAAGGGIASTASHQNKSPNTGDHIMVAGLSMQVLTLFIFIILCVDFGLRTRKRYKSIGEDALDQNPIYKSLRSDWKFTGFLVALGLATICIFWRSVYRVAELAEGWTGYLIRRQWLFVGFEGVMVVVACLALNLFHPAFTFKEAMMGLGGLGTSRKLKREEKRKMKEAAEGVTGDRTSASNSEVGNY